MKQLQQDETAEARSGSQDTDKDYRYSLLADNAAPPHLLPATSEQVVLNFAQNG